MKGTIDINSVALKAELKRRGYMQTDASAEMGFSKGYLGNVINRGQITESGANLLEKMCGIKRESYIVQEEQPKEEPQGFDYNKLYECIYTAVYHAAKKAWEDA